MSDIKDFYEEDAEKYDEKRFNSVETGFEDQAHQRMLQDFLEGVPNGGRILEIGCGTGRFTETITEHGYDVVATDFSLQMLKESRWRAENGSYVSGDAAHLPYVEDSFDACVIINVVCHLPDPAVVLNEINRVVRSNGRLFCNFTNLCGVYFPVGMFVNMTDTSVQEDVYSHWFSWFEIHRLLRNSGFEVDKVRGHMIAPRTGGSLTRKMITQLDRLVRDTPLKYVSGNLFVAATIK